MFRQRDGMSCCHQPPSDPLHTRRGYSVPNEPVSRPVGNLASVCPVSRVVVGPSLEPFALAWRETADTETIRKECLLVHSRLNWQRACRFDFANLFALILRERDRHSLRVVPRL